MVNYLLLTFAVIHVVLFVWSFGWGENQSLRLWVLRAMLFGMFYDNLLQSMGHQVFDRSWFETAHVLRYVFHVTVLPFLTLFALSIMRCADVKLADNQLFIMFCWLFTLGALSFGIYHDVYLLELVQKTAFSVEKLVKLSGMPPIATILTNLFVMLMAAAIWRAHGWKWLFLGATFIFLVNAATGPLPWGFVAGGFAEIVFIISLLSTERYFAKKQGKKGTEIR